MNIRGNRIVLRGIEHDDLPLFHGWFNDPGLVIGLGDLNFPSSLWQQERWFERIQTDEKTIRLAVQAIEGALIGYTGFWDIHWRDRRAEHAVLIGDPSYRGRSYGREIILTSARYAFDEMCLYRLEAVILETNEASLKAYQECGFQVEGKLRKRTFRGGKHVDSLLLGLLAEEYREWVKRNNYWKAPDSAE